MFIELAEVLACPACGGGGGEVGPSRGLVTRVDRLEGRRVLDGFLGCPTCEARYPIREGVVRFGEGGPVSADDAGTAREPAERKRGRERPETAPLAAALLGLTGDASGYVLLGPGLANAVDHLSAAAPGIEPVLLLRPGETGSIPGGRPDAAPEAPSRASRLELPPGERWPLLPDRFRGVAWLGGGRAAVAEAARVLAGGGRLAVLAPTGEVRDAVAEGPLELLAADDRALVAAKG